MSLFETKEWWSTRIAANEEFDDRHLQVGNIDNNPNKEEKIVVGSFAGYLRIYQPQCGEYQINDLVFEQYLEEPIIQLGIGNFIPHSSELGLCILFFKKLIVLQFTSSASGAFQCKKLYQHTLERNGYNMCWGNFAGQTRDSICVQSCDGMLTVYDQDKLLYMVQLDDFILPSPISYNPSVDSFIIQNSKNELELHRFSTLASSFNAQNKKKISPDWSINIGDQALKIECVCRNKRTYDFVVLTQETIFVIAQSGYIRTQKRFEYPAANFVCLNIPQKQNQMSPDQGQGEELRVLNLLISSFTHHLMVYEDFSLLWATKTEQVSHAMQVGAFSGQPGLIITLNDEGWLNVSYLGTEPPQIVKSFQQQKSNLTYEQMDNKYHQILDDISKRENNKGKKQDPQEKMNINLQSIGPILSKDYIENGENFYKDQNNPNSYVVVKLRVGLTYSGLKACNIMIFFDLPKNVFSPVNEYTIDELKGNSTPFNFEVTLYCYNNMVPYSTEVSVQASFSNYIEGKPINIDTRCAIAKTELPIPFFCRFAPAIKSADFKLTIVSTAEIPTLNEIFADVCNFQSDANEYLTNQNAVTFYLANGCDCTILLSKSSSKYRIQSATFEGIYFILQQFVERILKISQQKGVKMEIQYSENVPLQDLFAVIDEHYEQRNNVHQTKDKLEKKAAEFRTIQKRLLTRFKEKNPAPMNNLNILLQRSYEDLMQLGNRMEELQINLKKVSHRLSVILYCIHYLFKLRFNLTKETYKLILNSLSPVIINDESEIGWEEITNANVIYLLKVALNRELGGNQINIEKIEDFAKFKKQLTFLFDKLSKGAF